MKKSPFYDNLNVSLAMAKGTVHLQSFVQEFSKKVFAPPYVDWTTLAHCGNTDA